MVDITSDNLSRDFNKVFKAISRSMSRSACNIPCFLTYLLSTVSDVLVRFPVAAIRTAVHIKPFCPFTLFLADRHGW